MFTINLNVQNVLIGQILQPINTIINLFTWESVQANDLRKPVGTICIPGADNLI